MTAPVFLRRPLPDSGRFELDGPEGHHAAKVRRLRVGERVDVTDGQGRLAECVVAVAGREHLELDVARFVESPAQRPRIVVVQALVKGERSELAVELLTEVGVDEIIPWAAARCVATWSAPRSPRRWGQAATEASKQARRAWWPVVQELATTPEVVLTLGSAARAYVLHESSKQPLAALLTHDALPDDGDVVLVVGPEGGLTDAEIDAFETVGAQTVRLGASVLRSSTAGCVAAAVLLSGSTRWR